MTRLSLFVLRSAKKHIIFAIMEVTPSTSQHFRIAFSRISNVAQGSTGAAQQSWHMAFVTQVAKSVVLLPTLFLLQPTLPLLNSLHFLSDFYDGDRGPDSTSAGSGFSGAGPRSFGPASAQLRPGSGQASARPGFGPASFMLKEWGGEGIVVGARCGQCVAYVSLM